MRFTSSEIAACTGGDVVFAPEQGGQVCQGLSWDSRSISPGDLYVALPGNRVDGHRFVAPALRAGAACALVSQRPDAGQVAAAAETGSAIVLVRDAMEAISRLAGCWRRRLSGTVIALTGSSGKTTTKNLVRDVLSRHGETVATEANQNNELGVPATLLRAREGTRYTVVEMGMRGLGQLEQLCSFVQPDMALVTNVGTSHIELLGSRENIARAKAEPFSSLREGGVAFMNASDEYLPALREFGGTRRAGVREVLFDGSGADPAAYPGDSRPAVFASGIAVDGRGCPSFTLNVPGGSARCSLRMRGLHNVHNAVAAAAVGWRCGMDPETIADALGGCEPAAGRQQVLETPAGATVVDDSYNANPDSMRASLSMFASMDASGRHVAVLGDMGELGGFSQEGHALVGRLVADLPIDRLVCVGSMARGIAEAARQAGMPRGAISCADDAQAALALLLEEVSGGDAVLVKASHSMGLERIVEGLMRNHV